MNTTTPIRVSSGPWIVAIAGIIAGFILVTYGTLRNATDPSWQDTVGYLGHGLYIAEHGGLAGFLRQAFSGTYPIVERHPLYLLFLAPLAERSLTFFWNAKLLSLVIGITVLGSFIWMVNRRHGPWIAVISSAMYAMSPSLVVVSSHVNCEALLVLCILWAWWWLTAGISRARWAMAGLWAGLAFLTKATGLIFVAAAVVALGWHRRLRAATLTPVWVFLAMAALVASPLLVRNVLRHGTPLYEGINSHSMWFDHWRDLGDPASILREDRYGVWQIERNAFPTAISYFHRYGGRAMAKRFVRGVAKETGVLVKALTPTGAFPAGLGPVWSAAIVGLGLTGWWGDRRTWSGRVLAVWIGSAAALSSWYANVVPDIRFLAPVVPFILMYAGCGVSAALARGSRAAGAASVSVAVSVWLIAASVIQGARQGSLTATRPLVLVSPTYERLIEWMTRELRAEDTVLLGPTEEFHGLAWYIEAPNRLTVAPSVHSLEEFLAYLAERRVTHLVIHPENIRGARGWLAEALAPYWRVGPDGSIAEQAPLPGWRLVYADPGSPQRFLIYRPASITESLNAR